MRWLAPFLLCAAGCVVASEKKEYHASADVQVLEEENHRLKTEVARLAAELASYRGGKPARSIAGRVLRTEDGRVVINVGGDDGVRVDDIFHLRRGATYVGRMTVRRVLKAEATAEFDRDYPGGGAPPKPGDIAYVAHP
ncbi:MAG: hypothetical protein ACYTEZ_09110 [Planctomycetota bacterium]